MVERRTSSVDIVSKLVQFALAIGLTRSVGPMVVMLTANRFKNLALQAFGCRLVALMRRRRSGNI